MRATRSLLPVPVLLLCAFAAVGCDDSYSPTQPETGAVFQIRVVNETFRFETRDPRVIAEAEALIGAGNRKIASGRLVSGNGGVNAPWRWHIDPSSVQFSDASIELCDGLPSHVESDLDYWINTVRQYCPWSTEVVARIR